MQLIQSQAILNPSGCSSIPNKPQLHSRRHHCTATYNPTKCMPSNSWVRGLTLIQDSSNSRNPQDLHFTLVYEIVLFYSANRACTIYRTWDDFERLRKTIGPWKNAPRYEDQNDIVGLHLFLREAMTKKPRECAMAYFLKRRMEDCGGV